MEWGKQGEDRAGKDALDPFEKWLSKGAAAESNGSEEGGKSSVMGAQETKAQRTMKRRAEARLPTKEAVRCDDVVALPTAFTTMPAQSSSASTSSDSEASSVSPRRATKPKLPVTSIPDMRFEQSYLASVRGFVHEYDSADEMKKERQAEKGQGDDDATEQSEAPGVLATRSPSGEPELWLGRLRIQWCVCAYCFIQGVAS